MSQVKVTNKKSGITYVYESFSYWDKEKKQPRNKRKLIGKIDPETGEIVPTRGRSKKISDEKNNNTSNDNDLLKECDSLKEELEVFKEKARAQEIEIKKLKSEKESMLKSLRKILMDFSN